MRFFKSICVSPLLDGSSEFKEFNSKHLSSVISLAFRYGFQLDNDCQFGSSILLVYAVDEDFVSLPIYCCSLDQYNLDDIGFIVSFASANFKRLTKFSLASNLI